MNFQALKSFLKKSVNPITVSEIFFVLAVIFSFFPIRHVFFDNSAYLLGIYSDFTSISLYLSDIFIIIAFIFILPRGINQLIPKKYFTIFILWIIFLFFLKISSINAENIKFLIKMSEFVIVTYGTAAYLFNNKEFRLKFIELFLILGSFQSVLVIIQFYRQASVGLYRLGEDILKPEIFGLAKLVVNNVVYLRGYGTFPHPNPLSAFILVTILFNFFLLCKSQKIITHIILILTLGINIFGLIITFSRAGLLATIIGVIIVFIGLLYKKLLDSKRVLFLFITGSFFILAFFCFKQFLLIRATISDNATSERVMYANAGLEMLKNHPLIGVGIGESILHMQQYTSIKMPVWQIQPIHNYFLIAAVELGIPGFLLILFIFLIHVKQLLINIYQNRGEDTIFLITLLAIFVSFLALMQFDHYFYTLQQTQMLLWIVLGLISSVGNKKTEN